MKLAHAPTMLVVRGKALPIHRQIVEHVRLAVTAGQLLPGQRLPSARALAKELGVARGTVDAAYGVLAGEGFVIARGSAGTIVAPGLTREGPLPGVLDPDNFERRRSEGLDRIDPPRVEPPPVTAAVSGPWPAMENALALRICLPAFDAFPRTLWSRLVARRARALTTAGLVYPDPLGLPALRQAIAAYLAISRGIVCHADMVIVTGGFQAALRLIAAVSVRPGDAVFCEDPGYPMAREVLSLAGAEIVPVPVDNDGLRIADGLVRRPDARLALVTPSHQSPMGVSLSLPRRLELLDWASRTGAFVIEDDYDSEFRYLGRPLPALKSLDRQDRVLYAGTFSKVLYPGLRLGYLVVPRRVFERFAETSRILHLGLPALEQAVVADAIEQGHFARHVTRMRGLYATRRRALAAALPQIFGDRIEIALPAGGMNLLARFPGAAPDVILANRAHARNLWPTPLSALSTGPPEGDGLLLGFTNTPESEALPTAARLRAALDGVLRPDRRSASRPRP